MVLNYAGKKSEYDIIRMVREMSLTIESLSGVEDSKLKLIEGDNLLVMGQLILEGWGGEVDLIYIDPPFGTGNDFGAYDDSLVGEAYLEFIRERLILLKMLLSDKGSIYVHTNYQMGFYIKILLDEIFGQENHLSTITRIKCNPKNFHRRAYGNIKDMILFYTRTGNHIWNDLRSPLDVGKLYPKRDTEGRRYTTMPLHAPGETVCGKTGWAWRGILPPKGKHWRALPETLDKLADAGLIEWSKNGVPRKKIYAKDSRGKKIQDVWEYKDPQTKVYPTEKNEDLFKLIIGMSSNPDSLVLDAFCGSGSFLRIAEDMGRDWIGIDNSEEAIETTLSRFPTKLFEQDKIRFEYIKISPQIKKNSD